MSVKLMHRPASDIVLMSVMLMLVLVLMLIISHPGPLCWTPSSSQTSTCSIQIQKGQTPSKGRVLSLLFDKLLTSDATLAALTSTSSRRLLSQSPVSARPFEASQQAQHDPAATLHYLRRHLLVSTWHMRVQDSSIVMLLTGRAQVVLHTQQAACYTEPAVVSVPALAALP